MLEIVNSSWSGGGVVAGGGRKSGTITMYFFITITILFDTCEFITL